MLHLEPVPETGLRLKKNSNAHTLDYRYDITAFVGVKEIQNICEIFFVHSKPFNSAYLISDVDHHGMSDIRPPYLLVCMFIAKKSTGLDDMELNMLKGIVYRQLIWDETGRQISPKM